MRLHLNNRSRGVLSLVLTLTVPMLMGVLGGRLEAEAAPVEAVVVPAVQTEATVALETPDWPEDHRGAFLRAVAPDALRSARHHGGFPSLVMAQAILESGWGRSRLARAHGNLFGIKGAGVELPTREGAHLHTRASFRVYDSWGASIDDHGRLLSTDARYEAVRAATDWRTALSALAPVYATDPAYEARVVALIERYELDRWDARVREGG